MLVYERGAGQGAIGDHLAGPGPLAPDLVEEAQRLGLARTTRWSGRRWPAAT